MAAFRRDLERGRDFLWWPVAFGIGAASYFAPHDEPTGAMIFVAAGIAVLAVALRWRRLVPPFAATLAMLIAAGFLHAWLMTQLAAHPMLVYERSATVKGLVEAVENRDRAGSRLLLRPLVIDPPPREGLPPRIRLTVRGLSSPPLPGEGWQMQARIAPPAAPALPGGYDFARVAWFEAIGATGFSLGAPHPWSEAPPPGLRLGLSAGIEGVRNTIATRIRTQQPGDAGGIAAALIVGDRGGIGKGAAQAMRTAGLSHILSISGLHMSLVAASLFGTVRLLLALIPPIALNWPTKKIAAVVALLGTTTYFVFSGMDIPAERSAIMVAVMLFAILIDRRALSMRVIAVAALLALVISPEAVLDPGAEMSFAAVLALITCVEATAHRQGQAEADISPVVRFMRRGLVLLIAAVVTTTVAGAATAPIALYHFGRLSPLSLIANLMAAPLTSLVIMPAAMVSMLAMPFGLDGPPLAVMGFGIDGLIAIADKVAGWTPGGGLWGRPPLWTILAIIAGGLWICLWSGRKRWLGFVAVVAGIVGVVCAASPAMIVAGDGRAVLLRGGDGAPRLVGRVGGFERDVWLSSIGVESGPKTAFTDEVTCDRAACALRAGDGTPTVAVISEPLAFGDECHRSDIVVSGLMAPPWCRPPLLIDGSVLAASGASIYDETVGKDGKIDANRLVEIGRVYGSRRRPWQVPERSPAAP